MVVLDNIYITYLIKYQSESRLYVHSAEIMPLCLPSTRTSYGVVDEGHIGRGKGLPGWKRVDEGGEEVEEGRMLFQDK